MFCEKCGKRTASVHVTEIVDNEARETHLCEECAKKKGLGSGPDSAFKLADLLFGLTGSDEVIKEKLAGVKCPRCQLLYDDFRKEGRLGCAACYDAFEEQLGFLLKKIHSSNTHAGKFPPEMKKRGFTSLIPELKISLERAIQKEEFEEAARLRDRINELESKKKD